MASEQWAAVDRYIGDLLLPQDTALTNALAASAAAGLPPINVAPNQGKLLQLYAQMIGAKTILEIGTLGGYSTIWLARALSPGGHVLSLEADPKLPKSHAQILQPRASRHLSKSGSAKPWIVWHKSKPKSVRLSTSSSSTLTKPTCRIILPPR